MTRPPFVTRLPFRPARAFGALASLAVAACFSSSTGLEPPVDQLYFPTGLVVSPGRESLYVTSSDFDLRYSGGTVQELDVAVVRDVADAIADGLAAPGGSAATACGSVREVAGNDCANNAGLPVNPSPLLYPGPCGYVPLALIGSNDGSCAEPLPAFPHVTVRNAAIIGAFASGATLVFRPDGPGARLFVPVRGDPSVTYFDVKDDRPEMRGDAANVFCPEGACLECGPRQRFGRCNPDHRVGEDPAESQRAGLTLPAEPVGIASAAWDGANAIVVAHEAPSAASLVVNRWDEGGPSLEFLARSLPTGASEVAALPVPAYVALLKGQRDFSYQPGFFVTFRGSAEVDLMRYFEDDGATPPRPFLTRSSVVPIDVASSGDDSRGIAIDASARLECEAACPSSSAACLRTCADRPIALYVANRAPASLLIGRIETRFTQSEVNGAVIDTGAFDVASIDDTVPLAFGASKVALGHVIDPDGKLALRVFAAAFDSRLVFSYDPRARRVDAVIGTGRGPHALAFDTGEDEAADGTTELRSFLYVGHFTDSYIGVVDLDMRRPQTFGSMVATIGMPRPPREAK
jgi:hypothetical protein